MAKVLLVLATVDTPQPATQTFGGSRLFKIGEAAQITTDVQVTSDDLPDGDYTATCQSLDTTNTPIADMVSLSFTIAGGQIVVPGAPTSPAPAPGPTPSPAPAPAMYAAPSALSVSVVTP